MKKVECVVSYKYLDENAYFYIDDKTKHCFLIDPGYDVNKILEFIKVNNLIVDKILITHGHFDHISGVNELREKINVEAYSHKLSEKYLLNPEYNLSSHLINNEFTVKNVKYFEDGDIIYLNNNKSFYLRVMYTPGHTSDGCVFLNEKDGVLFSGDTLFKSSIGATHFPGGNYDELISSIKNKILVLNENIKVYPGHGEETTIKNEKNNICLYM